VWSDLARFDELSRSDNFEDLLEASDLHRGDFLDGVNLKSDPWEDWLTVMRRERREAVMRLLSRLARAASRAGIHPLAISTGRRLVDLDPLCEVSHRLVMHTYAAAGRRAEAVRFFGECAVMLKREIGVAPDEKTRLLLRDIKAGVNEEAAA
jgi:DNA-binding SARP family transcriptional activator